MLSFEECVDAEKPLCVRQWNCIKKKMYKNRNWKEKSPSLRNSHNWTIIPWTNNGIASNKFYCQKKKSHLLINNLRIAKIKLNRKTIVLLCSLSNIDPACLLLWQYWIFHVELKEIPFFLLLLLHGIQNNCNLMHSITTTQIHIYVKDRSCIIQHTGVPQIIKIGNLLIYLPFVFVRSLLWN